MRATRLLLVAGALSLAPGCLVILGHGDDGGDLVDTGRGDSAVPVDTDDHVVPPCDRRVVDALAALADAPSKGCGEAYLASQLARGANELTVQLFVDTLDGSTDPVVHVPGESYEVDLATAPPQQGFARLALGDGVYDAACTFGASSVTASHVWLGVAGTIEITVDEVAAEDVDGAPFTAEVAITGVVVDDGEGSTCQLPDVTWTSVALGPPPG